MFNKVSNSDKARLYLRGLWNIKIQNRLSNCIYLCTLLVAQMVKNLPVDAGDAGFISRVRKILWRRAWLPIAVFLPREFHGQRSLAGYRPCGCKELDMTK